MISQLIKIFFCTPSIDEVSPGGSVFRETIYEGVWNSDYAKYYEQQPEAVGHDFPRNAHLIIARYMQCSFCWLSGLTWVAWWQIKSATTPKSTHKKKSTMLKALAHLASSQGSRILSSHDRERGGEPGI